MVADGDSITFGNGSAHPYTSVLVLGGAPWSITNKGVSGETLATMQANYSTNIAPLFKASVSRNVVVIWGGTNDIALNGTSPSTVYSTLTSYISAAHATGFKVVVPTMLSRNGFDTQKNSYNALILANTAGADAIADFTGTSLGCDGCFSNLTWFNADGVHPTTTGVDSIEGPTISTAIAAAAP